ncbi:hypothetical protein [Leuconostoc citreum]|uniref:hypothetical protein n=1 Tax=Leuconostoc citreum TaxID=33964 RepID=UPI001C1F2B66|nr:hypothetical protein [Leuconostoc citreum]MBU7450012.1 hypothetical protein [Leuconostoc citreum]MCT3072537.1 hypothetical protein [Leuconostoc citreum]MCT3075930.1 hypothetical protein [Leuconostoc citreum]MCT3076983.1 hypothetical protein [Leuconostoc citreum]
MDEQTKQRLRHIRDATEVNTRHQQGLTRNSVERHERARVQIKSEVMENRQIDYKSHMKWLKN